MTQRVAIVDTSLLCCWLEVPGKETAGSPPNQWDKARTEAEITAALGDGFTLVLPFTAIVETGNHISHASRDRYEAATRLVDIIKKAASGDEPWAAFSDQISTTSPEAMLALCEAWPTHAARGVSLGDYLITTIADYYSTGGFTVRILSSDNLLASHVPVAPENPRRRR